MFSFQALLSTALSGSYSQGLIHRNRMNEGIADTENPLRNRNLSGTGGRKNEEGGQTGRERTCLWTTGGLFTDAEAGKDPSQQIIGAEGAGDFPERLLGLTQVFGQQLTSTRQGQLGTSMF